MVISGFYRIMLLMVVLPGRMQAQQTPTIAYPFYAIRDSTLVFSPVPDNKKDVALALLRKGNLYYTKGQPDSAMHYYRRGVKRAEEAGDPAVRQSYYLHIGNALLKLKQYKKAMHYLKKAIHLTKETGRNQRALNGHRALSVAYQRVGDYTNALKQVHYYLQLQDSLNKIETIRAIHEIDARYQVAQKDKAIIQRELQIARQQEKIRKKNLLLGGTGGGILFFTILGFMLYRFKRKIRSRQLEIDRLKAHMDGAEKERARLSIVLQDGLGGQLDNIKTHLRTLQKPQERDGLSQKLDGMMTMLHRMGEELHRTAYSLMPDVLQKQTIREALQLYCSDLNTGGVRLSLQFFDLTEAMDKTIELAVYRILQALIQTVVRHAGADQVILQVRQDESVLYISAEDNGGGFDPNDRQVSINLERIQAGVSALNGYYAASSTPGSGSTAFIEIDLKAAFS